MEMLLNLGIRHDRISRTGLSYGPTEFIFSYFFNFENLEVPSGAENS